MANLSDPVSASRLSVAPMMDWTDRHCRFLHRILSRRALLYTEMVTSAALVRGDARHLLRHDAQEHPVALQLGGSEPGELAEAARIGAGEGFDEINLNVGCPSDRVQSGCFGAVLMTRPGLVAECVTAMIAASSVEVTVKCRIGVDDQVPQRVLPEFLDRMRDAGVRRVAVHARKAWLQGLSPKENRDIPPLDHPLVVHMAEEFPDLSIALNGGVTSLDQAEGLLAQGLGGVMIGRAAYHAPWDVLARVDARIFGAPQPAQTPFEVVEAMIPYTERHLSEGGRLHDISRHMMGLFAGRPGARSWRRALSEAAQQPSAGPQTLIGAMEQVRDANALAV